MCEYWFRPFRRETVETTLYFERALKERTCGIQTPVNVSKNTQ